VLHPPATTVPHGHVNPQSFPRFPSSPAPANILHIPREMSDLEEKLDYLVRVNASSIATQRSSFAVEPAADQKDITSEIASLIDSLGIGLFTEDQELLQEHAQAIADKPSTKQVYIDLILTTRNKFANEEFDEKLVVAASNAMSILNYGELKELFPFQFRGVKDWSGIRVPYANLNCAQIFGCNFDNSDLSHCTLVQAALRGSSFRGAKLSRVWTGECAPLRGHASHVMTLDFSPDGASLASGSLDKTIRLWDVRSGACLFIFEGHSWPVDSIRFSPDGKLLASGSSDRTIRLWNVERGMCIATLEGHTKRVGCVRFSLDGKSVVSCSEDGTLRFWDVETKSCAATLGGYKSLQCIDFSPDGTLLAVGGTEGTILLNMASKERTPALESSVVCLTVDSLAFTPNGRLLAAGSRDGIVRLWNVESKDCIARLKGHDGWVNDLAITPDGKLLAAGSSDQSIRLWDIESYQCISTLKKHTDTVASVCFRGDGKWLASGSFDNTIRLWNVPDSLQATPTLQSHTDEVVGVSFSPDGKRYASLSRNQTIRLWDAESGRCTTVLQGHDKGVTQVAFNPDGEWLASCSGDKTIRIWNVETDSFRTIFHGVGSARLSPDGKLVASVGGRTVRVWNLESGERVATLRHRVWIGSVDFSPNGRFLVSGSIETVLLWDLACNECIHTWSRGSSFCHVSFSPDGKLLATGSSTFVTVWELESKRTVANLGSTSLARVSSHSFSPDHELLASGYEDGLIRLWHIASERCVATFQGASSRVNSLSFSPIDAKRLVSAYQNGTIRVWEIQSPRISLRAIHGSPFSLDLAEADFSQAEMDANFEQLVALANRFGAASVPTAATGPPAAGASLP